MCLLCRRPNARDRNCRFRRRVTAESRQVFGLRCIGNGRLPKPAGSVASWPSPHPYRCASAPDSGRIPCAREGESTLLRLYRPARKKPWSQRSRRPRPTIDPARSEQRSRELQTSFQDALTHPASSYRAPTRQTWGAAALGGAASRRLAAALCFTAAARRPARRAPRNQGGSLAGRLRWH